MGKKRGWKSTRPARGFQQKEPLRQGRDHLDDLKLKKELMKMVLLDHLAEVQNHLPEDEAETMTIRFLEESPHNEDEKL